jgi:hypothetical protein
MKIPENKEEKFTVRRHKLTNKYYNKNSGFVLQDKSKIYIIGKIKSEDSKIIKNLNSHDIEECLRKSNEYIKPYETEQYKLVLNDINKYLNDNNYIILQEFSKLIQNKVVDIFTNENHDEYSDVTKNMEQIINYMTVNNIIKTVSENEYKFMDISNIGEVLEEIEE